jgi:hypothetical protein
MMPIAKDDIELIELTSVDEMPTERRDRPAPHGPFWKAVIAVKDYYGNPVLAGAWYISKQDFPDSAVLSLVRNFFHHACKAIAEVTPDWHLDDAQLQALKRPSKPQSSNPV